MRFQIVETLAIILIMALLLFLPHAGGAQYPAFQYGPGFGACAGPFEQPFFPSASAWSGGLYVQSPYSSYADPLRMIYAQYYSYGIPIDPSERSNKVDVSQIPSEYVRQIELVGDYAYLLLSSREAIILRIVDISDPDNLEIVKNVELETFHNFIRIFPFDGYLFWIGLSPATRQEQDGPAKDTVGVFDISNPADPQTMDSLEIDLSPQYEATGDTFGFVGGDRAYIYYRQIKEGTSGLVVIDTSDPENLSMICCNELSWPDGEPRIAHILASDDTLFLFGEAELYLMDMSDPEHPAMLSTLGQGRGNSPHIPSLFGDYLCIPGGRWLALVDIRDRAHPELAGFMELPDQTGRFIKHGDRMFAADMHRGLVAIDISNPEAPEILPGYRFPKQDRDDHGSIEDLAVQGNLIYTAQAYDALQILDASDPQDVIKRGEIGTCRSTIYPYQKGEKFPDRLIVTLTIEAHEAVSLGKDGYIATFGIASLDQLNHTYGVFIIAPPKYPATLGGIHERLYRQYILLFPDVDDIYDIQADYEDDPHCVIAEFQYGASSNTGSSGDHSGGCEYYSSICQLNGTYQGLILRLGQSLNPWQYSYANQWTTYSPSGLASWSSPALRSATNTWWYNPLQFSLYSYPTIPTMKYIGPNIWNYAQPNYYPWGIVYTSQL
ncbi:MAG: LVIVD repeat-containing protein [bacterium]